MTSDKANPTQADMMRQKGYITAAEAARRIGRSVPHIYELLEEGKVRGVSVGHEKHARRYVEARSLVEHLGPDVAKLLGLV